MKHSALFRILIGILVSLLLMTGVAFATNYGTSEDPLVTLSYITSIFKPSILSEIDTKIAQAKTDLTQQLQADAAELGITGGSLEFEVVTLSQGQTLIGDIGTELLLRVGSASCVADSAPGLIDSTDGSTLNGGSALKQNHLYMVTVEGRGIKATAEVVKVVVRGGYTIS